MKLAGVLLNLVEVVASDNRRCLVDPAERDGFLHELELCTAAAREVEYFRLEVLHGNERPGVLPAEQMDCAVETLHAAVSLLNAEGYTVVVELLNTAVDHPGSFLDRSDATIALIRRVGSPRVLVLFEIHFRNVFRAIYDFGDRYRGYVTAENHPTDLSFRDLERVKQLAGFGSES